MCHQCLEPDSETILLLQNRVAAKRVGGWMRGMSLASLAFYFWTVAVSVRGAAHGTPIRRIVVSVRFTAHWTSIVFAACNRITIHVSAARRIMWQECRCAWCNLADVFVQELNQAVERVSRHPMLQHISIKLSTELRVIMLLKTVCPEVYEIDGSFSSAAGTKSEGSKSSTPWSQIITPSLKSIWELFVCEVAVLIVVFQVHPLIIGRLWSMNQLLLTWQRNGFKYLKIVSMFLTISSSSLYLLYEWRSDGYKWLPHYYVVNFPSCLALLTPPLTTSNRWWQSGQMKSSLFFLDILELVEMKATRAPS